MSTPLTIVQVAYPFSPVGPASVGGAEQVLASLDGALVRRGHRSIVVAHEDSHVQGRLVGVRVPRGMVDGPSRAAAHRAFSGALRAVLADVSADVVHLHGVDFHHYLPPPRGPPVLATLHLPPDSYPARVFAGIRRDLRLCCVSRSQLRSCPEGARFVGPVPNGVALDRFEPRLRKERWAVALGRICPEKGFHLAMDAARRARVRLLLAGEVQPYREHVHYFARAITPRLGRSARFIGPVGPRARKHLLARARCVLVPSLVAETSCLVAMEALASATPVVAFDRGAIRETVEHGRTGFVVRDVAEMQHAIEAVGQLDPRACRRSAERRLSASRMHDGYLALYRKLAAEGRHGLA